MSDFIPRQYNYVLETGAVGTDNEDIANILYNINQMEMKSSFLSDDKNEMDATVGDVLFMISDSKIHFKKFFDKNSEKLDSKNVEAVQTALDGALKIIRTAEDPNIDVNAIHPALLFAYKKILPVVPILLSLDDQALGKV